MRPTFNRAHRHKHLVDNPERSEYFVPAEWVDTVSETQAVHEVGTFGKLKHGVQALDTEVALNSWPFERKVWNYDIKFQSAENTKTKY